MGTYMQHLHAIAENKCHDMGMLFTIADKMPDSESCRILNAMAKEEGQHVKYLDKIIDRYEPFMGSDEDEMKKGMM